MAIKDYFYSEKHKSHLLNLRRAGFVGINYQYVTAFVNGKEFTEQIAHGETPVAINFGDSVLVASGEESEMKTEYILNK